MLKRLLAALAACAMPLSAAASPQLALEWGHRAANLLDETADLIGEIDRGGDPAIDETYTIEVERFAVTAARLGRWSDARDGAKDLGCIFRGMADEGDMQALTLASAAGPNVKREALRRLAAMFSDAEIIALASTRPAAAASLTASEANMSCPASAEAARYALR